MAAKEIKILGDNGDNTYRVSFPDDLVPEVAITRPQPSRQIRVVVNGIPVTFDSEDDYRRAQYMLNQQGGGRYSAAGGGQNNGAAFLTTGGDAVQAVSAFFSGRNLRQRREELYNSAAASATARDRLAALTQKYPELVPVLIDLFESEREVMRTSIIMVEDEIAAVDLQTGGAVARVIGDLWSGTGNNMGNMGGYGAIAGVGLGLGVGLLWSRNNDNTSGTGRSFR